MQINPQIITAQLKRSAREALPSLWVRWHLMRLPQSAETELSLLKNLISPADVTVDVGANYGLYTRMLARLSSKVHAFEPSSAVADILRRTSARNVIVHGTALSDRDGEAKLRVPRSGTHMAYGLASLELNAIADEDFATMTVPVARLDSVVRDDVTFVKVDVEGHEINVLRGAQAMIERCRPIFLVEAEERHRAGATASIFNFFKDKDYEGFFMRGRDVATIAEFDPRVDQDDTVLQSDGGRQNGRYYVNNFFFFPFGRDGRDLLTSA